MKAIDLGSGLAIGTYGSARNIQGKSSVGVYESSPQDEAPAEGQQSAVVSISGRAMLLSRLFNTDALQAEPRVETLTTTNNTSGSVYSFLTRDDRDALSRIYEYASSNGLDLAKVDALAFDLGVYRMAGPGGPMDSAGYLYDPQGSPLIPEFDAHDEAVAQRVLTSKAVSDTLIDRGFLEAIFSPTRMSVHASDFSFLEKAVYSFSGMGSDGSTDQDARPVVRYKKEDFPPLKLGDQTADSGKDMLLSRLLGKEFAGSGQGAFAGLLDLLSSNDRNLLGMLYSVAQLRGEDLSRIDSMAMTMGNYRMLGKISSVS